MCKIECDRLRLCSAACSRRHSEFLHINRFFLEQNSSLVLPFAHHLPDPGQLCGHSEPVSGRDCEQTKMRVS